MCVTIAGVAMATGTGAAAIQALVTGMAIAAIGSIVGAIVVIAMAGGIRLQPSEPVRSLAGRLLHRRRRSTAPRLIAPAMLMCNGAMTAIGPTGLPTTRSSPITVRAGSAIRLIAKAFQKKPAAPPRAAVLFPDLSSVTQP